MSVVSDGAKGLGFVFIEKLFGSDALSYFGIQSTGVTGGPMASTMASIASVALYVAPLITIYILVMGLIYSSQEGVVLGKRWNAMIVPIRGVFALSFSAPVVPGGISAIQVLIIGLALFGNFLGNMVATQIADTIYMPGSSFVPKTISTAGGAGTQSQAFASLVGTNVCIMAARNLGYGTASDQQSAPKSDSLAAFLFSDPKLHPDAPKTAPATDVSLSKLCAQGVNLNSQANPGYPDDQVDCSNTEYPDVCNKVQATNKKYQKIIEDTLKSNNGILTAEVIQKLGSDYRKDMISNINPDLASIIKANHDAIDQLGWIGLGQFFQKYGAVSGELDNYIFHSANPNFDFKKIGDTTTAGMALGDQTKMAYHRALNAISPASDLGFSERVSAAVSGVAGTADGALTIIANGVSHNVLGTAYRNAIFGVGHSAFDVGAFEATQRFGALLTAMGTVALNVIPTEAEITARKSGAEIEGTNTLNEVVDTVTNLSGAGIIIGAVEKAAGSVNDATAGTQRSIAQIAIYTGLALSTMTPFVPPILFIFQTLMWVFWLVVGVVASPLWVIMHMMPQGDDPVHEHSKHGWKLLLFITLFPTLVVAGFAASIQIFNVSIPFAFEFIIGMTSSSTVGAVSSILLTPVIVGGVVVVATLLCFNFMITIPQAFANWIGIGVQQHESSDKMVGVVGMNPHTPGPSSVGGGISGGLSGSPKKGILGKVLGKVSGKK